MSLVKHASHQIRFSRKKTVSSSWLASHAAVDVVLMRSRVDIRHKSGSGAKTRQDSVLYYIVALEFGDNEGVPMMSKTYSRIVGANVPQV
jgi:hypothetical protein